MSSLSTGIDNGKKRALDLNDDDSSSGSSGESSLSSQETTDPEKKKPRCLPLDERWVDWNKTESWGKESLIRYISYPELDNLVGWATHVEQPSVSRVTRNSNPNPLVGLTSESLPPSLLGSVVQEAMAQALDGQDQLWESFDTSAMVSLGMVVEEMMTAMLLPLASQHVARCRSLEEADAFQAWTLPPEEALDRILIASQQRDLSCAGLVSSLPATRTTRSMAFNDSTSQQALEAWLTAHNLDLDFVQSNKELFNLLLPSL
jgi:hypothetical protein